MAGPRRRSREIALQILHQIDAGGVAPESDADVDVTIARYFEHLATKGGPAYEEDEDDGDGRARREDRSPAGRGAGPRRHRSTGPSSTTR